MIEGLLLNKQIEVSGSADQQTFLPSVRIAVGIPSLPGRLVGVCTRSFPLLSFTIKSEAEKLFSSIADGLQDTLKLLDFEEINKAVDLISKARQICVYGFGNSYTVCKDIETRFMRFGIPVKAYCDLHMQLTASSLLTQEDLIIAVSHTGSNIDLLQSIELAHDNKIPIIAITSYMNSPLCKLADVVLHGMGREVAYKSEAVASRLIHMAIVDVLYMGIYQHNVDKGFANIEKMRAAIAKRRL